MDRREHRLNTFQFHNCLRTTSVADILSRRCGENFKMGQAQSMFTLLTEERTEIEVVTLVAK